MANPDRGEVDLVVMRGEPRVEKTYVLRPTCHAIRELQHRTGKTYGQLLGELGKVDYDVIAQLLFMLLQPYHAKEFKTIDHVDGLIDDAGGHNGMLPTLIDVMEANKPPAKKKTEVSGEPSAPDPLDAQAGTGANSSETGVVAA